jgi:hypothetical protein
MIAVYLTPASIGYLTQFILAVVINGFLFIAPYPKIGPADRCTRRC